jgi:hypothetical protein
VGTDDRHEGDRRAPATVRPVEVGGEDDDVHRRVTQLTADPHHP